MRIVRTYEAFWNKKTPHKRMSAREIVEYTIFNYKEMEKDSDLFEVSVDDNYVSIAWEKSFRERNKYHVCVSNKNGVYLIQDFYDDKGESMYGEYDDPKMKHMTKINTIDTKISKSEFENYYNKLSRISDYLFELDEEKTKGEKVGVGEEGLSNFEVTPVDQIGLMISEHLRKYINKDFKFDTLYHVWSSSSKNEKFIEEVSFKLKEFKVGQYMNDTHLLYGLIVVECSLDKKEYELWVDDSYKSEWVDLDDVRKSFYGLRPRPVEKMSSRKISRFYKDESNYPNTMLSSLCPSKYDTIEMLKEFVGELSDINTQIKNKFE